MIIWIIQSIQDGFKFKFCRPSWIIWIIWIIQSIHWLQVQVLSAILDYLDYLDYSINPRWSTIQDAIQDIQVKVLSAILDYLDYSIKIIVNINLREYH